MPNPTNPGTRMGTVPLPPGSPGGAQTPMQLPPAAGGQPLPPWAGATMRSDMVDQDGNIVSRGKTMPLGIKEITREEFMGGGQPPNPFFGNTGLTPADLQPQPTSLSPPQTGIDYGQDLPGIMEQYKSRGRLKNLANKSGRGNNGR